MKTTAIMNLKGGTGKTVSTINLAAFLAVKHGQRVLLIDADSQGNLTEFVSEKLSDKGTIYDLLTGKECIALQPTRMRQVDILQADPRLMALDITAAGMGAADQMALKSFLAENADLYDRVLIDCPPAFSAAAAAALIAADDVIIPMKLDAFGIRGMANLLEQIRNMRKLNPKLHVAGVLPTMYYRSPEQDEAEGALRSAMHALGVQVFHHIRRSRQVDDSTFLQRPLLESSPKSGACRDYKVFTMDLMNAKGGDKHGV